MVNVLSLFDGISCGQLALQRAGVKYEKYFASEIEPNAIKIAQKNFPETIQIGDVRKVDTTQLPKIDLLIGGSPCQGFSYAGSQLNFNDSRSKLFFEYVRILKDVSPAYFLLENVVMKQEYQDIISEYLGVKPLLISSGLVSAQKRRRLYWTNIPVKELPVDKKLFFDKFLFTLPHGYVKADCRIHRKYPTLTKQIPSTKYRVVVNKELFDTSSDFDRRRNKNVTRCLTPEECEELQTLPIGYTSGIGKTKRYECIGNGWTVDVIAHIFSYIRK